MTDMYVKLSDLAEYCDTNSSYLHGKGQSVAQAALRRVKEFAIENAADVQPMKHGKWITGDQWWTCRCSNCYHEFGIAVVSANRQYLFCPHCGVRMDGDTK